MHRPQHKVKRGMWLVAALVAGLTTAPQWLPVAHPQPELQAAAVPTGLQTGEQPLDIFDGFDYPLTTDAAPWWSTGTGTWSIVEDGGSVLQQTGTMAGVRLAMSTGSNYRASINIKALGNRDQGLVFRAQDTQNYYYFSAGAGGLARIVKVQAGVSTVLASTAFNTNDRQWYRLAVDLSGSTLRTYVGDRLILSVTDTTFTSGRAGIRSAGPAEFDEFAVQNPALWTNDFSAGATDFRPAAGTWTATGGQYIGSGAGTDNVTVTGNRAWTDYAVSADLTGQTGADGGLLFRAVDSNNFYLFRVGYGGKAGLYKRVNGSYTTLTELTTTINPAQTHRLRIEVRGQQIRALVDGTEVTTIFDGSLAFGQVGFRTSSSSQFAFDNLVVSSLPDETDTFTTNLNRWTTTGTWSVTAAQHALASAAAGATAAATTGWSTWTDYRLKARIQLGSASSATLLLRAGASGDGYGLRISNSGAVTLLRRSGGVETTLASSIVATGSSWHTIEIDARATTISAWIDSRKVAETTDSSLPAGGVRLEAASGTALFDDVDVTRPAVTTGFNSTDYAIPFTTSGATWAAGSGGYGAVAGSTDGFALAGDPARTNYSFRSTVTWNGGAFDAGLVFWAKDSNNLFLFRPYYQGSDGVVTSGIYQRTNGAYTAVCADNPDAQICDRNAPVVFTVGSTHTLRVDVDGQDVTAWVDDVVVASVYVEVRSGQSSPRYGNVGLRVSAGTNVTFDDVQVTTTRTIDDLPRDFSPARDSLLPRQASPATSIDTIDITNSSASDRMLVTTLQGLVNRTQPRLYVTSFRSTTDDGYKDLSDSDTQWQSVLAAPGRSFTTYTTPSALVTKYASSYSGAILYDPAWWDDPTKQPYLDIVTTMAGVLGALPVTPAQNTTLGLPVVVDVRTQWTSIDDAQQWAYDELWPRTDHTVLADEHPSYQMTTDYYVANKIFVTMPTDSVRSQSLFSRLLREMPPLSSVMGVWSVSNKQTRTVSTAPTAAGATSLTVHSNFVPLPYPGTPFEPMDVFIGFGTAQEETATVTSVSGPTMTFSSPLSQPHPAGSIVRPVADSSTLLTTSAAAGATTLTVDNTFIATVGKAIYVGTEWKERRTVTAISGKTITVSTGLSHAQPAGAGVTAAANLWSETGTHQPWTEEQMVARTSGRGLNYQVTWMSNNLSVWSGTSQTMTPAKSITYAAKTAKTVYLTFNLSDGDNIAHVFRQRQYQFTSTDRGSAYLGYTMSPALYDLAPEMLHWFQTQTTAQDYLIGGHGGLGYVHSNVLSYGYYPQAQQKIIDNYIAESGRYNQAIGNQTFWPIFTNIESPQDGGTNTSLQQVAKTPGVTGLFNDFVPEPMSQCPAGTCTTYADTIRTYNGIPAFRSSAVPDLGTVTVTYPSGVRTLTNYGPNGLLDRIAADVAYITPNQSSGQLYVFTGLSGFGLKTNDLRDGLNDDGTYQTGLFSRILATPRYQALINAGWSIKIVRPDEFIYQYTH